MTDSAQMLELAERCEKAAWAIQGRYKVSQVLKDAAAALRSSAIPETGEPVVCCTCQYIHGHADDCPALRARPSPDGAVREALLIADDLLGEFGNLYGSSESPRGREIIGTVDKAKSKIRAALSTAPQQGGEPVVTRPERGTP